MGLGKKLSRAAAQVAADKGTVACCSNARFHCAYCYIFWLSRNLTVCRRTAMLRQPTEGALPRHTCALAEAGGVC